MTTSPLLPYSPELVNSADGVEQRFTANVVHIEAGDEGTLIAFGDLLRDPGVPLRQGTPRHSLLLQLPPAHGDGDGGLSIELNDQGNTREADTLSHCELGRTHFRAAFRPGTGPFAGRVSLSPEIELFTDEPAEDAQLDSVCVEFEATDRQYALLRRELERCADLARLSLSE
jgi:hypothetical protein